MCVTRFILLAIVAAATQAAAVPADIELVAERNNHITYILYNSNTTGESTTSDTAPENFAIDNPTVVLIHGQGGNAQDLFSRQVRQAFRDYAVNDWNVLVMDWNFLASGSHNNVVNNVPRAADDLVRLLETLLREKNETIGNSDVHLVGFGIGAHLAGNAGNQLRHFAPIARITGLDPIGRSYGGNSPRLSPNDADYVEVIHTSGGVLGVGIGTAIGHVDFFMNGGNSQPGCSNLSGTCDHNRSYEFFVASLYRNHLIGNRCNSMTQVSLNSCSGPPLAMGGEELLKVPMLPGIYRANTGRNFPF